MIVSILDYYTKNAAASQMSDNRIVIYEGGSLTDQDDGILEVSI